MADDEELTYLDDSLRSACDFEIKLSHDAFEGGSALGRNEGFKNGCKKGFKEGVKKERTAIIGKMKKQGYSLEQISNIIKIPVEELFKKKVK